MMVQVQKVQDLQEKSLQKSVVSDSLMSFLVLVVTEQHLKSFGIQPAAPHSTDLHSNCHLQDCWVLADRDE